MRSQQLPSHLHRAHESLSHPALAMCALRRALMDGEARLEDVLTDERWSSLHALAEWSILPLTGKSSPQALPVDDFSVRKYEKGDAFDFTAVDAELAADLSLLTAEVPGEGESLLHWARVFRGPSTPRRHVYCLVESSGTVHGFMVSCPEGDGFFLRSFFLGSQARSHAQGARLLHEAQRHCGLPTSSAAHLFAQDYLSVHLNALGLLLVPRTNMALVPPSATPAPLPEGYRLVPVGDEMLPCFAEIYVKAHAQGADAKLGLERGSAERILKGYQEEWREDGERDFSRAVCDAEGNLVGFCLSEIMDDPKDGESFIRDLAVLPAHSGRGLGRALLTATLAAQEQGGKKRCTLTVTDANVPALNLYTSIGFRVASRYCEISRAR